MPIFDVQLIGPVPGDVRTGLARRIADASGEALGSPPQRAWVRLRILSAEDYAENAGGPPPGVHPVLVSVLQASPSQGAALAEEAARLTRAIAGACRRPAENVHLIYEPPAKGRISFGGSLLE